MEDPLYRAGKVSFGGIQKEVNLAYVPEAQVGDYVIVHVGFAISRVDEKEAMQDEYGERVWNDAIPNDTRICSVDALTRSSPAAQYPGRGLSAYRRALDWLLLTEARDTEQAA